MLSWMLKLSIARFIRWYESVRSCWTTFLLLVCVFISVYEKSSINTTATQKCDESEEISKRLTFFLTRRTIKRVEYNHERVDL